MGYRVLPDGSIVAESLEEAIALQRQIRETAPANRPAPRPVVPPRAQDETPQQPNIERNRGKWRFYMNRDGVRHRGPQRFTKDEAAQDLEAFIAGKPLAENHLRRACGRCRSTGHNVKRCPHPLTSSFPASAETKKEEHPTARAVKPQGFLSESATGPFCQTAPSCLTASPASEDLSAYDAALATDPDPDEDEDFAEFLPAGESLVQVVQEHHETAGDAGAPAPPAEPPQDLATPITLIPGARLTTRQLGGPVRSKTIAGDRHLSRAELAAAEPYPDEIARPLTRGDCLAGARPCPWVSCRHHLYLDVSDDGAIKLNFPDLEPDQLDPSCSLDEADKGEQTLEAVGAILNVTRERTRQIEARALVQLAEQGTDFETMPARGSNAAEDAAF